MKFEWYAAKERKNIEKHGLDFVTAVRVFGDPYRIEYYDVKHSDDEDRYITIGMIDEAMIMLFVVYSESADAIRIISARNATAKERRIYHDRSKGD